MPNYYLWDDPFSYTVVTFDFLFHIFPDYVKVHQIYESELFYLGRYTLNSHIYVRINKI